MFFKKLRTLALLLLLIPINAYAYSPYVIAGGENIGIELNSSGILVVGMYKVNNIYPANESGIKVGDLITSVNDTEVNSINELVDNINKANSNNIKITYVRDDISKYTNLSLYKENNIYKTGLYVKDSIIGIGTLTYIDPNTKIFGALGHEITERESGIKLDIRDGAIFESTVTSIDRSKEGTPGEKNARYNKSNVLGNIYENTISGVFGYYSNVPNKKLYKVASPSEVVLGSAKILTVISNNDVKEYNISILKVNDKTKIKNILFEVTDKDLLNTTGGIIQGMSGSPIIQDNKIIGAVTHVVIDDEL